MRKIFVERCNHCESVVDFHDTFKDNCPDCGRPMDLRDDYVLVPEEGDEEE